MAPDAESATMATLTCWIFERVANQLPKVMLAFYFEKTFECAKNGFLWTSVQHLLA